MTDLRLSKSVYYLGYGYLFGRGDHVCEILCVCVAFYDASSIWLGFCFLFVLENCHSGGRLHTAVGRNEVWQQHLVDTDPKAHDRLDTVLKQIRLFDLYKFVALGPINFFRIANVRYVLQKCRLQ